MSFDDKHGVYAVERVGHGLRSLRVVHPFTIDDETVFVTSGRQPDLNGSRAVASVQQRRCIRGPAVECASDEDAGCARMLKSNVFGIHRCS